MLWQSGQILPPRREKTGLFVRFTHCRYNRLKEEADLKETELEQLRSRLQQSTHHQLLQEYQALQQAIGGPLTISLRLIFLRHLCELP